MIFLNFKWFLNIYMNCLCAIFHMIWRYVGNSYFCSGRLYLFPIYFHSSWIIYNPWVFLLTFSYCQAFYTRKVIKYVQSQHFSSVCIVAFEQVNVCLVGLKRGLSHCKVCDVRDLKFDLWSWVTNVERQIFHLIYHYIIVFTVSIYTLKSQI